MIVFIKKNGVRIAEFQDKPGKLTSAAFLPATSHPFLSGHELVPGHVGQHLEAAKSWEDFLARLQQDGMQVEEYVEEGR